MTDSLVIGAGVIGLAVARELAMAGRDVVVLERHPGPGMETSSRNSEVLHAGIYYPPGSLKARLCAPACLELHAWCETHRVGCRRIGKFIVATCPEEEPELARLLELGHRNGVAGLRYTSTDELRREEPDVRATAALWSPDTGIVDSHGLVRSLEQEALDQGAVIAYGHAYVSAEPTGTGYRIRCSNTEGDDETVMDAATVVNCAGLEADEIAAGMGIDVDAAGYRQVFVKGSYFRLREGAAIRPRHLVYPVPNPALMGLGVHVTVDLAGGVRFGPDVEFLAGRLQDYRVPPARAAQFAERAARYLPALRVDDLRPDQSGIRPRLVLSDGVVPDFVIAEEGTRGLPGWINLVGMESPGLTCCLAIAREVRALM
ncbi:MAG TPA: NAD(P)/FAD-dependent oxidoreductase [Gemmatimonadales bacterium]|nr:NAD(P)/FAD-dependent oxidoreductase [Gemmatimonadales bacterium]